MEVRNGPFPAGALIALITNWSKHWTDLIPKAGALIVMAFPKPRNGSGFPPGAIAICP